MRKKKTVVIDGMFKNPRDERELDLVSEVKISASKEAQSVIDHIYHSRIASGRFFWAYVVIAALSAIVGIAYLVGAQYLVGGLFITLAFSSAEAGFLHKQRVGTLDELERLVITSDALTQMTDKFMRTLAASKDDDEINAFFDRVAEDKGIPKV